MTLISRVIMSNWLNSESLTSFSLFFVHVWECRLYAHGSPADYYWVVFASVKMDAGF